MRVAFHAGQLLQPVPGGIGSYVRSLLAHLPGAGVEPIAFAAGPRPDDLPLELPWVDLGHPYGTLRYELWQRFRRPLLKVEADIVHTPSLVVPPVRGLPLVVTVHDIGFVRLPESTTSRGRAFHTRGLALARRDADLVVTPSEFTRTELLAEGFDSDRVIVAHLGCEPPEPRGDEEIDALVAECGITPPFVLTVGTIEPRKGLPVLAEAVTALRRRRPNVSLAVAGPTGWGDVRGLERPGVRRLGALPWGTLDALYRRAAVCCLPSTYEGFGLPAVEALARGCPLVASDATALPEVVGDAGLLVPPGDAAALADALERVLDDEELRARLQEAGPRRAAAFSWAASARAHVAAYAKAVQAHATHT